MSVKPIPSAAVVKEDAPKTTHPAMNWKINVPKNSQISDGKLSAGKSGRCFAASSSMVSSAAETACKQCGEIPTRLSLKQTLHSARGCRGCIRRSAGRHSPMSQHSTAETLPARHNPHICES